MKLVGIVVVRDEADVIGHALRHALSLGLDELLVEDNGSTDGTVRLLRRMARHHAGLRWRRSDGPFEQKTRMNALAQEARERGADWVVPFDADEFIICRGDLRSHLATARAPALTIRSHNLVPNRSWRRAHARRTQRMDHIARPWARREDVVAGRASWLELDRAPKVVFRAAEDAVLDTGQHGVRHPNGRQQPTFDLHMLHAPIRSRNGLWKRTHRVSRHFSDRDGPTAHWHLRRLVTLMHLGRLADEWRACSHRRGWLSRHDGSRVRLERIPAPAWARAVTRFV